MREAARVGATRCAEGGRGYRPPTLTIYGDLRTMTLGGTPGVGDSGGGGLVQKPGP